MKKCFFALTLTALVSFAFVSCDKKDSSSKDPDSGVSPSEEFIGQWIFDEEGGPFYDLSDYITGNINPQYAELSEEYYVYGRQGNYEKVQELRQEMEELKEYSTDTYMGRSTAVEITSSTIKIGDAEVYLNATSSQNLWASGNVWFLVDFSTGTQVLDCDFFKMSVFVENWRTYHYTIKDGILYFNNGKECMFRLEDKLIWEDNGDLVSMAQLLQNLRYN